MKQADLNKDALQFFPRNFIVYTKNFIGILSGEGKILARVRSRAERRNYDCNADIVNYRTSNGIMKGVPLKDWSHRRYSGQGEKGCEKAKHFLKKTEQEE